MSDASTVPTVQSLLTRLEERGARIESLEARLEERDKQILLLVWLAERDALVTDLKAEIDALKVRSPPSRSTRRRTCRIPPNHQG